MSADGHVIIDTKLNTKGAEKEAKGLGSTLKRGLATGTKVAAAGIGAVTAAAGAATGAVVKATKATMEYGVEVNRNSQKLNMSKKGYQEWSYVLKRSGTSIDSLRMGMKKISTAVDEARNGSKSATENFKRLGISVDDLKGKSQEDIFGLMVERLQGIKDTTERSAIANKFFGRSAQEMAGLLNKSGKDVEALKKQANDLGLVLDDKAVKAAANFRGSLTVLQSSFEGLRNKLGVQFLPALTKVTDGLSLLVKGDEAKGLKKIQQGVDEFTKTLNSLIPKILKIGGSILKSLGKGLIDNLPTLLDAGAKIIGALLKGIAKAIPVIAKQIPSILGSISRAFKDSIGILIQELPKELKPLGDALTDIVNLIGNVAKTFTSSSTAGELLRTTVVSLASAYAFYALMTKASTIATTAHIAASGLETAAIIAMEFATKGAAAGFALLTATMNINPFVAAATAIIAVGTALGYLYMTHIPAHIEKINLETQALERKNQELQKEYDKAQQLATQHQENIARGEEEISSIQSRMSHLKMMTGKLSELVDEEGRVRKGREKEVEYILGEYNSAMDTNYKIVNGQVTKYGELKNNINKTINAKRREMQMAVLAKQAEEAYAKYADAQERANKAKQNASKAEKEYSDKIGDLNNKLKTAKDAQKQYSAAAAVFPGIGVLASTAIGKYVKSLEKQKSALTKNKDDSKKVYQVSKNDAAGYYGTMLKYQSAYLSKSNKKADKILRSSTADYKKAGTQMVEGVASGWTTKEAYKKLDEAAKQVAKQGVKALRKHSLIKSPSKLYAKEVGYWDGAGVAVGTVEGFKDYDPFKKINAQIMTGASRLRASLDNSMNSTLQTVLTGEGLTESIIDGLANSNLQFKVDGRDFARLVKGAS